MFISIMANEWHRSVQLTFIYGFEKPNVRRIPKIISRTVNIDTFIRAELDLSVCS